MTTLQPELQSFRHELRAAVEADLVRHRDHRRHLRRAVALGTPAGLAALGLSLALVLGAGSTPSPADAAILASAQGALTPPPDSVFHVAATITVGSSPAQPYALWAAGSSYRAMLALVAARRCLAASCSVGVATAEAGWSTAPA